MNPKLLGSLLVGIIVLTGVYIGSLSLNQQPISQNIVNDQQAQVSSALPSGLTAYLTFDNSSLADTSGNSYNGSWSGSSSFGTGKIGNGSISLGGSNYVSINNPVYSLSGGTVAFWFKKGSGGILTGSYGGAQNQRAPTLTISSAGKLGWEYGGSAGMDTGIAIDSNWHHVAMTYTNAGAVSIYLDGSRIVSTTAAAKPESFFGQVHIGHYGNYGSSFGANTIDDFRIYNKALSASEISAVYNYTGVTVPTDTTAPTISGVSVSGLTENQATVSWSTNEASDSYVEYGISTSYGSNTLLDISKVTSHSQVLSGLLPNTTYNYRVTSKDAAGNSASSANATFTTKSLPDTASPSIPSGITVSNITQTGLRISWVASTDNVGVVGYKVYRNGSEINTISNTVYADSGLAANTSYSYTVAAYDAVGNVSAQSVAVTTKTLQSAPTVSLSANPTSVTSGQPSTLSWISTDSTTCTAVGGNFAGIKSTTGSQAVITTSATQTSVTYSISCTGPSGVSPSSSVTVSVAPAPVVTSSKFKIGDRVQTINTSNVRATGALSATLAGTQYTGSIATVVDDPNVPEGIKNSIDGYYWWKLDFETGVDGYVGEDNIKSAVLSTNFKVGDRIQTTEQTNVRAIAALSGTLVGTRAMGSIGTIVGGGAQNPTDGFYWWKIDYDGTAIDGYSGQGTLKVYSVNQPTTFTVTTAKAGTGSGTVTCSPNTCTANTGSAVTVTAAAASGSTLAGLTVSPTAAGTCTTTSCTLTSAGTVTATFNTIPVTSDTTKPTVTTFTVPSTSSSLTVTTSVVASDNVGVTGYLITESATVPSISASGWTLSAPTSYTFTSAGVKTLYAWAKDLAGNVSLSRTASVTVTIASAKFTIPQSVIPNATVNVRSSAAGTLLGTQSTTVPGTTVAGPITASLSGVSYEWWNINFDSGIDGWVGQDGLDAYTPPAPDTQAPTVPTGLIATAVSSTQINLSWNASTDNVGVVGYKVYKDGVLQANSNPTARTFQSMGLTADTVYSYTVSAYDAVQDSAQSASASVRTLVTTSNFNVTTAKLGSGSGTISCNPSTCSIAQGSTVLVSATAASGSTLAGITVSPSSAGSCTINSCSLTSAGTVTATFNVIPVTSNGGNWYLNANVSTSGNGTSWSSAWKNTNNIVWSSIQPGDTIWVAGGSYGSLAVGKSGTAANLIYIKRVVSSDIVPTAAAGWSASFDSRATFGPLSAPVSYVYIDGRVDMGMRFISANGGGTPSSYDATNGHFVTVDHVDLVGPSAANSLEGASIGSALATFNGDNSGVNIGYGYPSHSTNDITVRNSRVRGHPNEFWFANAKNVLIENNKIYDNGAANSVTWHGNLMIVNGSDGIIFRNNEVFNWQVEGLYPWGSTSRNWYVYGNVFHDGIGGKSGSTHRFLELRSYSGTVTHGPFYVYNNTIANAYAAFTRGDTTVYWSTDSVARNNLVYNVAGAGVGYLPAQASNNVYIASPSPFVSASDYHLKAPLTTAGVSVPNVLTTFAGMTKFEVDPDGKTRGADGVWDIGAYEY